MSHKRTSPEERRRKRMEQVDALHPDLRACVHDYGYHVVNTLLSLGLRNAQQVRHAVEVVLDEFSPTRGSRSAQGPRTELQRQSHD